MGCENSEKYPKGAWFVLANIFFDRFSNGGFFSILVIYLNQKLLFDKSMSTALYHLNEFLLCVCAIIGAVMADSFLGKFRTIAAMSIIYLLGAAVVAIAAVDFEFMSIRVISFIGMTAVMIGSGGVKSCQNALGGDLFKLPEQAKELDGYFTLQFISMKLGQVIGQILFPILLSDIAFYDNEDSYSLVFGVSSLLMVTALTVFLMGRKSYVHNLPGSNVMLEVMSCIFFALKSKISLCCNPKDHWLDHSENKFGAQLVEDTKVVLRILVIHLPLFVFWALINQQMSRWVFQATFMDGNIGNFYTIKPAQMVVISPFCVLIFLPIFKKFIFPMLELVGLKTPLRKMGVGMFLAGVTFLYSAYIENVINTKINRISILWLLPQNLLAAFSEVFLLVANISFAYTEAPKSMKSVVSAMLYLSLAGGSLIIFLISGIKFFESQVIEFLFFACLMFVATFIFIILAMNYKYNKKAGDAPV